jgi:hypothetical protein
MTFAFHNTLLKFKQVYLNNFIDQYYLSSNKFSQTFWINNISDVHLVL